MADPRRVSTRRAVLSYEQLKQLTQQSGALWPDLLVKDYQGILQDFVFIADEADELELGIAQNEVDIEENRLKIIANFKYLHGEESKSPDYDESSSYVKYDLVTFDENEYLAINNTPNPAGAFDPSLWAWVSTPENARRFIEHIDQSLEPDPHPQYKLKLPGLILYGTVDNFTFNTTASKLVNYSDSLVFDGGSPSDVDQAAGEITIPESGVYRLTVYLNGTQGNTTKEETMLLQVDVNSTKFNAWAFDVATDKTDARTFAATVTRQLTQNDIVSLFAEGTADMGLFTVESTTLELVRIA